MRGLSTIIGCSVGGISACSMCINDTGRVYSFGVHTQKAHGHKKSIISKPKMIKHLENVKSISCGRGHTLCLDMEGNVYGFGKITKGRLGISKKQGLLSLPKLVNIPQKIGLSLIKEISCGYDFSMCLSRDGELYSFGANYYGQLGHGDTVTLNHPKKIEIMKEVDFVQCSYFYVICKNIDDEIFVWGINDNGQLGIGHKKNQMTPFKHENWMKDVVDVKCGREHTLVLTSTLDVYSFGENFTGKLGRVTERNKSFSLTIIPNLSQIIRIECGFNYSMCIDIENNLFVFGDNTHGQLGLGDVNDRFSPTKHPSLSNIIDISSGGCHTFVKTVENQIFAFGINNFSQLGIDTHGEDVLIPTRVFKGKEDIWCSNNINPRAKSARN